MSDAERIAEARRYAEYMHQGQLRIGGAPYITHPFAVCEYVRKRGYGTEYQITALFHDLLEDTEAEESEILKIGGKEVLTAVKCLTKSPGYIMEEYVAGIIENPIAYEVKGCDRLHNLRCMLREVKNKTFKERYIRETRQWYMDFNPEIPEIVAQLEKTVRY